MTMMIGFLCFAALLGMMAALMRIRQSRRALAVVTVTLTAALLLPMQMPGVARAAAPNIELENLDKVPYSDRLVFNKIQNPEDGTRPKDNGSCCIPPNVVHDQATLRVHNTGDATLSVTSRTISGPWEFVGDVPTSFDIPAGGSRDIRLKFNASAIGANGGYYEGSLTIASNDPDRPSASIQLAGFWQNVSEQNDEPNLYEILRVFGYRTTISTGSQRLANKGVIEPIGDEVLSRYWRRADSAQPVKVYHLAAFHTQGDTATIYYYNKGSSSQQIVTQAGVDGQSLLPRNASDTSQLAFNENVQPGEVFGFRVANEYSDPARNTLGQDYQKGCLGPCGHHIRFWPVRDRSNLVVPNQYILAMDYNGINYDYNDNVYLVTNITPESPTQSVLYRLDTGVTGTKADPKKYFDAAKNVWTPDREDWEISIRRGTTTTVYTGTQTFFTPGDAIDEGANSDPIDATSSDTLYRTYRGRQADVNTSTKTIEYQLPLNFANVVDLRLHFAERAHSSAGKRVFDIEAEGIVIRDDFDIFARSGAKNRAYVEQINGLNVPDKTLNLVLRASVDFPSISAIEVLCNGSCTGADATAPAIPTGLTATPLDSGIALDWNNNSESDFREYRVYRSDSSNGTYTRIATLTGSANSQYSDTSAPRGVPSFYRVTAVDNAGNESGFASASATRPGDAPPPPPPPPPSGNKTYIPLIGK